MSGALDRPVRPILFVDNQDSFVWNLVDYVSQFYAETAVRSNQSNPGRGQRAMQPLAIVISPGPGHPAHPRDIGSCLEIIKQFGRDTDTGRLPGAPGHEHRLRRHHLPHQAAARQDLPDHSRRKGHLPGAGESPGGAEGITPWPSKGCPRSWRSRPGPQTGSSWACGTRAGPTAACSSIPSRCSRPPARS